MPDELPPSAESSPQGRSQRLWLILLAVGLVVSALLFLFPSQPPFDDLDAELEGVYLDYLTELHQGFASGNHGPERFLTGFWSASDVETEMAKLFRQQAKRLELSESYSEALLERHLSEHQNGADSTVGFFHRSIELGGAFCFISLVSLLFLKNFFHRRASSAPLLPQNLGARILAYAVWGLLLGQMAASLIWTVQGRVSIETFPILAGLDIPMLGYGVLQGFPLLFVLVLRIPQPFRWLDAWGLRMSQLKAPSIWAATFGLFAIDFLIFLGVDWALSFHQGFFDTRDFMSSALGYGDGLILLHELLTSAVLAPVGEELLFRGILFYTLKRWCGFRWAALLSSILFASYHSYSLPSEILLILFGILMCWSYERTQSLWPAILVHAAINAQITLGQWYLYANY